MDVSGVKETTKFKINYKEIEQGKRKQSFQVSF